MDFSIAIIALAGILMPVFILAIIFGFANRSEARFHDTVQKAIENGQKLDESLLSGMPGYQRKRQSPRDDIRNGLITASVGVGIALLGSVALGSVITGAGLLVLCIGAAIFAYGYFSKEEKSDSANQESLQTDNNNH